MKLQAWRKTAGAAIFGRCSRKAQVVQVLGLVFALAGCAGRQEAEPRTVRVVRRRRESAFRAVECPYPVLAGTAYLAVQL